MIEYYSLENNHNNTVQFHPSVPRRLSLNRFPVAHNLLAISQVHNHHEQQQQQQQIQAKRYFDSEIDNDERIDSAIESRSLSINTSDDGVLEVNKSNIFLVFLTEEKSFRTIINN